MRINNIINTYDNLSQLKIVKQNNDNVTIVKFVSDMVKHHDDDLINAMYDIVEELSSSGKIEENQKASIQIEIEGKGIFKNNKLIHLDTKQTKEFIIRLFDVNQNLILEHITEYTGKVRI